MAADPVLYAYGRSPKRGAKTRRWRRIGCAYPHEAGSGLNVVLEAYPQDGRIVLLELDEHDERAIKAEIERLRDLGGL